MTSKKDLILYPTLFLIIFFAGFSDATTGNTKAESTAKTAAVSQALQAKQ